MFEGGFLCVLKILEKCPAGTHSLFFRFAAETVEREHPEMIEEELIGVIIRENPVVIMVYNGIEVFQKSRNIAFFG